MPSRKNVFVLGAGRCGTSSFAKACQHITNWSAAHETKAQQLGYDRLNYPARHIEVDHLLSWRLGSLIPRYPDALYVHLMRDPVACAESWAGRNRGVLRWWWRSICGRWSSVSVSPEEGLPVAFDMVTAVNDNIRFAIKDVAHLTIWIDTPDSGFASFCDLIEAEGDLTAALQALRDVANMSRHSRPRRAIELQQAALND